MRQQRALLIIFTIFVLICGAVAIYLFVTQDNNSKQETVFRPINQVQAGYSAEQATADGCVVFYSDDAEEIINDSVWNDFVALCSAGIPAKVRLYFDTSDLVGVGYKYTVQDITFNGEKYIHEYYSTPNGADEPVFTVREYKYLNHSKHITRYRCTDDYLLTDDPDMTSNKYFQHMVSSQLEDVLNATMTRIIYSRELALSELADEDIARYLKVCKIAAPEGRSMAEIRSLFAYFESAAEPSLPVGWESDEAFVDAIKEAVAIYYD